MLRKISSLTTEHLNSTYWQQFDPYEYTNNSYEHFLLVAKLYHRIYCNLSYPSLLNL